jgi:hypothetical protein
MKTRNHRSRLWVAMLATAVVGLFAVMAGARAHARAHEAAADWSVTSSIADGATLASPVQWSAEPVGTPPGGLDRIEFLIDGKLLWVEHNPPFDFNNDGNYLYPYLFARGSHQMVARGVAKSGEQVTATANVHMTQAPPKIPRALRATWKHRVSQSVIERNSVPGDPPLPAGVYRIKFRANGVSLASPPPGPATPGNYAFSATARGRLDLGGPVNWLTAQSSADGICHGDQTFGRYRWKIHRRVLTVKLVKDPCRLRAAIQTGHWRRG